MFLNYRYYIPPASVSLLLFSGFCIFIIFFLPRHLLECMLADSDVFLIFEPDVKALRNARHPPDTDGDGV